MESESTEPSAKENPIRRLMRRAVPVSVEALLLNWLKDCGDDADNQ